MENKSQEEIIRTRILDWAAPNFPLEIRDQAARVYVDFRAGVRNEETDAFSGKLAFGTGGMRGVLGTGPGRLNKWTVGRAALGFVRYIKETYHNPSLVIAHDSRRMSPEFARVVAGLAVVQVLTLPELDHTFLRHCQGTVRQLEASSGEPPE